MLRFYVHRCHQNARDGLNPRTPARPGADHDVRLLAGTTAVMAEPARTPELRCCGGPAVAEPVAVHLAAAVNRQNCAVDGGHLLSPFGTVRTKVNTALVAVWRPVMQSGSRCQQAVNMRNWRLVSFFRSSAAHGKQRSSDGS
jgi:hypothetical protein